VVVHEHVGMHLQRVPVAHAPKQVEKMPPIPLVIENPLTVVSPRRDVIPAVLELSAQGPSHGRRMPRPSEPANGQMWNVNVET